MSEPESRNLPPQEGSTEIELSADEVLSLSRATAFPQSLTPPPLSSGSAGVPVAARHPLSRSSWRSPLALACAGSALFLAIGAGYRYGTSARAQPTSPPIALQESVAADESPVSAERRDLEPIRFQNPFDKREVFEFPPGTSEQEAHDAVAHLLLQRAMERQAPRPHGALLGRR